MNGWGLPPDEPSSGPNGSSNGHAPKGSGATPPGSGNANTGGNVPSGATGPGGSGSLGSSFTGSTSLSGLAGPSSIKVSILVAAPPDRIAPLAATFRGDARFSLAAQATSAGDVHAKLSLKPEAALVDARVCGDLDGLSALASGYDGSLYVILPADITPSVLEAVRRFPAVRDVVVGEPNLPELAGRIYAAIQADRQLDYTGISGYRLGQFGPRSAMVGWRCIAVWSLQGGTGRSTLATALALEAAERRLPTLLVGLGVPDVIPLRLNFSGPEPNLLTWAGAPTVEHLKTSVRPYDVLDVLAGFPDQGSLDDYLPVAMSSQQGLPALSSTAAHAGYAVVVLDVSSPELAAPAISAANTLVMPASPLPDAIYAVGEASRMVSQFMANQHGIPLEGTHLVLNRVRDTMLAPDEFMRSLGRLSTDTPSLAAVILDDPRIDSAHTQFRPAYNFSEPLRTAMKQVGDLLFAPPPGLAAVQQAQLGRPSKAWRIGPLRIKR